MSANILVVGSLNMDLVIRAPRHPQPGETLMGSDFQTIPGGKGANQAVASARAGAQVTMLGRVGPDDFGRALVQTLSRDAIDTRFVLVDPSTPTGIALITLDAQGQNTIILSPGANGQLSVQDIRDAEACFKNAAVVVLQLESPLPAVEGAINLAKRHGARVILNPAPAQPLAPKLLSKVDYLVPNESECALLTGKDEPRAAASSLCDAGVHQVVVTLGSHGVMTLGEEGEDTLPAHHVDVVDTTAAGDAFIGAFAAAIAEGRPFGEALRWGNAAGAIAVTRPGAQPSLPTRDEIAAYLEEAQ